MIKKNLIYTSVAGPSSLDAVSIDEAKTSILEALLPYFNQHPKHRIKSCFIGLDGIVFPSDSLKIENAIKEFPYFSENAMIAARNDMENALYSGSCFEEGMSLICGTKMVAFGKRHSSFS